MDTFTHGIAGALIGKAFFAGARGLTPESARRGRVAVFAATLGAVFPDADVVFNLFDKTDLATLESHRGFTHSFVCLPAFAVGLAAATRWFARRRGLAAPSWGTLTGTYAAGLAVHILLDMITSFGTMIWSPLAKTRATWDLTFILDLVLTGIVLLPQVAAWVHRRHEGRVARGLGMWTFFSLCAFGLERVARGAGFPFSPWAVVAVGLALGAILALPAFGGVAPLGAEDTNYVPLRAGWCRAGVIALAAYLTLCAAAHRTALQRVEQFAATRGLHIERIGALPLPPSAAHWAGLVRTAEGVYEARYSLLAAGLPAFRFVADSAPNGYLEAARQLPKVKVYLWFARFPVFHYAQQGERHVVEISDLRFTRPRRNPAPFTFRVVFDVERRVLEQGWAEDLR